MPKYIKTKGGYFYKIINGKKKRISLDEYKRRNKISGGAGGGGSSKHLKIDPLNRVPGQPLPGYNDNGYPYVLGSPLMSINKTNYRGEFKFNNPYLNDIKSLANKIKQLYDVQPLNIIGNNIIYFIGHYKLIINTPNDISKILTNYECEKEVAICLYVSLNKTKEIFQKVIEYIYEKGKDKPQILKKIKDLIKIMIRDYTGNDTKKVEFMAVLNSIIVNRNGNGGGGGGVTLNRNNTNSVNNPKHPNHPNHHVVTNNAHSNTGGNSNGFPKATYVKGFVPFSRDPLNNKRRHRVAKIRNVDNTEA